MLKIVFLEYQTFVKRRLDFDLGTDDKNLRYWQNQLFLNFLIYCTPISLVALTPGIFMAAREGLPVIIAIDLFCFFLLLFFTFSKRMSIRTRKVGVISIFYILSIFLINILGYLGPGVFYLFFISVLASLIFPIRHAYLLTFINAILLAFFALVISQRLFGSALIQEYTPVKWIAFSTNLIFASILIVLLIDKIFQGLQSTILTKTHLEEQYKSIFYKSPLPMWLFDTDTLRFLDVNEAAVRHYGYAKEEFLSMTIRDIRPAKEVPEIEDIVKKNKISGKYYDGNSMHIKKDKSAIYVKIESNLLNFEGYEARIVLATDITKQVEYQLEVFDANKRVEESEMNLKAIFESTLDGFVLIDKAGKIITFNPRAEYSIRFNKRQNAFKAGKSIFDYIEVSRLPYFHQIMHKVHSGETVEYDRKYLTSPKKVSWIRYTVTPVRKDNIIIGACITGRDITERKLYLKSLEDQNKVFREISWVQSHMVRGPLARIMGLIPLLKSSKDENERIQVLEYLDISTQELDNKIKEINDKSNYITEKYPEN
ncbi:PAS domain S-box protein [Mucilaginibacter jinjuensis]|uniref:PAS domain S-box protein n=1 Tax=Mucilaginibacter jinjuensis TaxID=1176721 RepID=A0ABY7TGL6_9SPHI|nr:PAS domain S-box protein [Mucilaginibacter jinjuensis]WCT14302.1 PAS domain S-box protein [Mucilaginibacter jinjuensis]